MYIIYSIRQTSWVSKAGNYTSDIKDAKQYGNRTEVIKACQRHSYNKAVDWMPVLLSDMIFLQEMIK